MNNRPLIAAEAEIVNGLDPVFRPFALRLRDSALSRGLPFVFLSGLRSRSQQAAEVARVGRTTPAAPAGKSKHEIGFAFDTERQTAAIESQVGALAESLGLKWGGRFVDAQGKPSPDPNHFEAPATRSELSTYRNVQLVAAAFAVGVLGLVIASD